mgnify:CR=1 FL=1
MVKEIKIVIEYPGGQRKIRMVKSVDEAFRICRTTGGLDWKAVSYRPRISRVG